MIANSGRVEVVVGGMFSGKTEELIRRIRRARMARQNVLVFKPSIDNRYSDKEVASHDQTRVPCFSIRDASDIWDYLQPEVEVVGIDEAQFFDADIVGIVERLAKKNVRVICAGLDTDWRGKPFQPVPSLMAIADEVTKLHAVCVVCGAAASRTQKVSIGSDDQVEVGSHAIYEARCRHHFVPALDEKTDSFSEHLTREEIFPEQRFDI